MESAKVNKLIAQLTATLSQAGVKVTYVEELEEGWSGEYMDLPYPMIWVNENLSPEETLVTITHESVHFLQYSVGWFVGVNVKNPNLSSEEDTLIEQIVMQSYLDPEDWKLEFPAWKLELYPTHILSKLEDYVSYVLVAA
jgi:hypothetical protein